MPTLVKPRSLGFLSKCERRPPGASLILSIFAMFDLAAPSPDRFEGDQGLWILAAKELPPGTALDIGMPKPQAEVLVGGHAAAPGGQPTAQMMLGWAIPPIRKQILVTGDRYWQMTSSGWRQTAPHPFLQMPLAPNRAFGGPSYAANPAGAGHLALARSMGGEAVALPNLEIPEQAIRLIEEMPPSAKFGPMAFDAKERLQYAGTYDSAWLKKIAPGLATDADPRLFLFAPQDQRLGGFLSGGEPYALQNFSADQPLIQGHLPSFRVRCFIGWKDTARGVDELPTRIDTLWLFAGARRGIFIYRAAVGVETVDGSDVADIMLAYERQNDPPRPFEHYLEVRRLRLDKATAARYAFSEHQLAPGLPQAELERRAARRRQMAKERAVRRQASMQWVVEQELDRLALPEALRPQINIPPPDPGPSVLELLPEELESGEIDLAEILDALDAIQTKVQADIEKMAAETEPMRAALKKISSGEGEPEDIDALLAAIGVPDAPMDTALAQMLALPNVPPQTDPAKIAELESNLDRAKNWRNEMVQAARPAVDESEQLRLARARFFSLSEGRPLAMVREALSGDAFSLPEMPPIALPEEARNAPPAPPPKLTIDAIVAQAAKPNVPAEALEKLRTSLAEAETALVKALPALGTSEQTPLEAFVGLGAALDGQPAKPAIAATDIESAIASADTKIKEGLAEARSGIDRAEEQLEAGMAAARRMSPEPLKPDTPLAPAVARALGDIVEQEFRSGGAMAGRDLAGADLSGRNFAQADFSGAFLERANLTGAKLAGTNFAGATLAGAILLNADMSNADLTEANLGKADCRGTRFAGAQLVSTKFLGARAECASFDQAKLHSLQVMKVSLTRASFRSAQVEQCCFMQTPLDNSAWDGATIQRTQFMDVTLSGAGFAGARLERTCFLKASAPKLDFSGSQLHTVCFIACPDLTGARFTGSTAAATLSFLDADVSGADFSMARLDRAYFGKATLAQTAFRMASLKGAILSANDLRGADFYAANLLEARLNKADLRGANLRHANLFSSDLMDSALDAADLSNANINRTILLVARDVN